MEKRIDIKVSQDGNQVCALYGKDLQEGVAGFGDTLGEALLDFSKDWLKNKKVFATELKEVKKVPVIDRRVVGLALSSYWESIRRNSAFVDFVDKDFVDMLFKGVENE